VLEHVAEVIIIMRSLITVIALGSLSVSSLLGCASPVEADDLDAEQSDEALTSACELGRTCRAPLHLVAARSFSNGPPAKFRSDVQIDQTEFPKTPRIVAQATSRPLTQTTRVGLALRGATPGSSWKVDNLLLVEVLDAVTGTRMDAAFAGYVKGANVMLGGAPLRRLGTEAFEHAAGEINLGSLLPVGQAFRLRVSALDNGVEAYVTDVFADVTPAVAPPPPAPPALSDDPFDPSSCTGPQLTASQVLAKFPHGASSTQLASAIIKVQNRRCNDATGCTAWENGNVATTLGEGSPVFPLQVALNLTVNNDSRKIGMAVDTTAASYHLWQRCWWNLPSYGSTQMVCESLNAKKNTETSTWSGFDKETAVMGDHCYRFVSKGAYAPTTRFGILARF